MFELEDFSSIHDGIFNKNADIVCPSLDFYVSDSMQDMIDVDIRAEIAHIVGSSSDLTSSLDHTLEAISAINNNNINSIGSPIASTPTSCSTNANMLARNALHDSPTAKWMGSCANFWTTPDYFADVGACVNPISVMPLINSNCTFQSPLKSKTFAGDMNGSSASGALVPASPNGERESHKSHLTFSPAQMKVSAGSLRREKVMAHIPKQISAPIPSTLTDSGSLAPATMASNALLQRRNTSAVDAVRKDLGTELRKLQTNNNNNGEESSLKSTSLLSAVGAINTIKLGPGIGGLTFANSATYNKLKQQGNGTVVCNSNGKREGAASPLPNGSSLHTNSVARRSLLQQQTANGRNSPKNMISALSPHHSMQSGNGSAIGSPSSSVGRPASASSPLTFNGNGSFSGAITPLSSTSNLVNIANNSGNGSMQGLGVANINGLSSTGVGVKPLQQKVKLPVAPYAVFPKPAYSYSCLIALALKNSRAGSLPVSEIYSFLCQHFPYFENAPSGWKNSVRHNLSLNKCFEKIERPVSNSNQRKGCRWAMNPDRIIKMDEEVQKWSRKDPAAIREAMVYPEHLEALERGEMKHGSADVDAELDSQSEIEETSDLEEQDFDETVDAMLVEEDEDIEDDDEDAEVLHEFDPEDELNINASRQPQHLPDEQDLLVQKSEDFDIEVDELYDAIDIEENKIALQRILANGNGNSSHIIELNPAELRANANDGYISPKRARLDINYAIGPAGELEQKFGQKVKVQPVLQALGAPALSQKQPAANTHYNRRKMPLVNRII